MFMPPNDKIHPMGYHLILNIVSVCTVAAEVSLGASLGAQPQPLHPESLVQSSSQSHNIYGINTTVVPALAPPLPILVKDKKVHLSTASLLFF